MNEDRITYLEKGGIYIQTSAGAMQLGVPPETIKDSLGAGKKVPHIYIAPKNLFSFKKMASLIDIEFPCYYNFFVLNRPIIVLCTKEQKIKIEKLMIESLLGPSEIDLESEYQGGQNNEYFPDLRKEMDFFAKHPVENRQIKVDDMVKFIILEDGKTIFIDTVEVTLNRSENKITLNDNVKIQLDWDTDYKDVSLSLGKEDSAFIPPHFGITTLGSSHGFDPKGKTSGFIFWINGSGILVDPPIDSSLWLLEENVDPSMINSMILTHCHGDHDAGVMQKILLEGRIKLYTTPTVFSSFVRKISVLTGLSNTELIDYIEFAPVSIGKNFKINGADFKFSYRLHSIPTIGFEVNFKGKNVLYTSDHLNDKETFDKLYKNGTLTKGRYEELYSFYWDKDVIIHEAGVPPLHTPIDILLELPEEAKERIYLVHTDKSKIPEGSKLSIPETGLSNTMVLNVPSSLYGEAVQVLNLVSGLDIFQLISFQKAHEFLGIINYEEYKKGDVLIEQGKPGEKFFIIITGHAIIKVDGNERSILRSGCYFGETAMISEAKTTGTIVANTDLLTIAISKDDFLMFISNTPIYKRLKKLGFIRSKDSWQAIEANPLFSSMTINQKNHLEAILNFIEPEPGTFIVKQGEKLEYGVLWNSGTATLKGQNSGDGINIGTGYFLGYPGYMNGEKPAYASLIANKDSSYFKIPLDELNAFFHKNPGVLLKLQTKEHS